MPCRCDYMDDGCSSSNESYYKKEADQATRAGCDMRTILRRHNLEPELCAETREWIAKHDKADAKRIKEENTRGEREALRQKALDKLSLDERRVLGL